MTTPRPARTTAAMIPETTPCRRVADVTVPVTNLPSRRPGKGSKIRLCASWSPLSPHSGSSKDLQLRRAPGKCLQLSHDQHGIADTLDKIQGVDTGEDPHVVAFLERSLPDHGPSQVLDSVDLARPLWELEQGATYPGGASSLDVHPDRDLAPARIGPEDVVVANGQLHAVVGGEGNGIPWALITGGNEGNRGTWEEPSDLLDLEKPVLDDNLNLLQHGEDRVAQFTGTGSAEVEAAAAFSNTTDEASLLLVQSKPDHVRCQLRFARPQRLRDSARVATTRLFTVGDEQDMVCHAFAGLKIATRSLQRESDWRPADRLGGRDLIAEGRLVDTLDRDDEL